MRPQASIEPDHAAWLRFLRAHAALTRELSGRLETAHGVSLRDYDVLVQLYHAPDHRLRRIDLARTVILSPSGITRLLEGLERAGWVAKHHCDSDQRVTYAVLTDAGLAKVEDCRSTHLADIEELFASRFSAEEREQLAELLGRLPLADAGACNG
ncbi:MAG TPA: MarR family transcriptional regulator [Gaiellaceae bacterium]|nr:MarR family transcriptional regulator [Gaiellaceae bacterium]